MIEDVTLEELDPRREKTAVPHNLPSQPTPFIGRQIEILADYAAPIPGVLEALAEFCRRPGVENWLLHRLQSGDDGGIDPGGGRAWPGTGRRRLASDVPAGRPYPWMLYRLALELDIYPMTAVIKIGDTVADVEEGLNAGAWSVGVALTGNEMGLTAAELAALELPEYERLRRQACERLAHAGAHHVVDSLADAVSLPD